MRFSELYGKVFQSVALPIILAPTRSKSTRIAGKIRKHQRWPIEKIHQYQLEKLNQLIGLARRESPFYRKRWQELGIPSTPLSSLDEIHQYPVTTKNDLESNFPDGLAVESRRGTDWQYVGTRGTTRRVMVIHDFDRRDVERAAAMVALTEDSPFRYGTREVSIPPDACSVHCGIESERAETVTQQLIAMAIRKIPWNRESMSDLRGLVMNNWICSRTVLPPLSPEGNETSIRDRIDEIRKNRPLQLAALPEYLRALADYIHRTGDQPPPVPIIRPMGANFPRAWQQEVESAFRGSLREHYGSREMGPMAFDCRESNGLHVLTSQHIIEVVRNGASVAEGEIGRVLVTDLYNHSMPIIRYDIGDLARIYRQPCKCGRNTPRIFLEGRTNDAFVTESGRILSSDTVSNFFAAEDQIQDFELTEKNNGTWVLRVVVKPNHEFDESKLVDRFQAWSGQSRPIKVRFTQAIQPESSGKFRHCKSRSFELIDTLSATAND